MTAKRELQLAVLLCLLGSAVALLALGQTWFSVEDGQRLSTAAVRTGIKGSTFAPGARALGYVGLAGVVALAATKRWGRLAVGVLVLAAGIGIVIDVASVLRDGLASRGLLVSGSGGCGQPRVVTGGCAHSGSVVSASTSSDGWPWVTVGGGVVLAVSGALVAARGRTWAALSSSYQPPAAREAELPVTDKGVWDALDRGEDPTG